jgi:hypothetical protein
MLTSKYRRLSSWGTALIPGTLKDSDYILQLTAWVKTYGSAISLSVSLMIRLGSAIANVWFILCRRVRRH